MKLFLLFFTLFSLYGEDVVSFKSDESSYRVYNDVKGLRVDKKMGDYALVSALSDQDALNWAKKFKIVEMGGVDNPKATKDFLKKRGILNIPYHIGYDWMPAFYYYTSGNNREFVKWLYKNRFTTTLNPDGPFIHCKENGYDWCRDYFYDWGNEDLLNKRVDDLCQSMKKSGFNGLFFDWAPGIFIKSKKFKKMHETFKKRHPQKIYVKQVGKFYKKLKDKGIFFVTNQAFRNEKYLLKYITYDMTESYITTDKKSGKKIRIEGRGWVDNFKVTNYFPIYKDSTGIKDSLHFINLLTKYKKRYKKSGFKNFIYLNYLAPEYEKVYPSFPVYRLKKPKNGIYFSYAMAKLTDNIVYAEVTFDKRLERDDIYFYDLGKVLGESYEKIGAIDGYVRFYTKGFVLVVNPHKDRIFLTIKSKYIPKNRYIYDAYNDSWLKSGSSSSLTVKLDFQRDIFTKQPLPLGRVYLYNAIN